ncbi:MAG: tetratricopeptide repeat protein [Rhodocyclaceae bacterium]
MSRVRTLVAALCALSCVAGARAADNDFDPGPDVSPYRRFLVYPHVQKGQAALARGDARGAIEEFQRARELTPRSAYAALMLAQAYRANGEPERALTLLQEQQGFTPDDARIVNEITAMQTAAQPAASLPAASAATSPPSPRTLEEAETALRDPAYAQSAAGLATRHEVAQRAIFLRQWGRADTQFEALSQAGALSGQEALQWLRVLLAQGRLADAQALAQRAGLQQPDAVLALAQGLASGADAAALSRFMQGRAPRFERAEDEAQWIGLLQRTAPAGLGAAQSFVPRFAANRQALALFLVPRLLAANDVVGAQRWLAQLPQGMLPESRFELDVRAGRLAAAGQRALGMVRRAPTDMAQLDNLSYRLLQAHGNAQSFALLMEAYPFERANEAERATMFARMQVLLTRDPSLDDPATIRARLARPLNTTALRSAQAALFADVSDCPTVLDILGDLSPDYGYEQWMRLGECYRPTRPGLSEYAFEQASQRHGSVEATRAVAYQSFATHDYDRALAAWRALPPAQLSTPELLAAATTALAAGDRQAASAWLDRYAAAGATQQDAYWWMRAQAEEKNDPAHARAALERAIAMRPDARYYARLAALDAATPDPQPAVAALRQAVALDPDSAQLRASLGYAHMRAGENAEARDELERAHGALPDDIAVTQALVYTHQRLADNAAARRYARAVVDDLDRKSPRFDDTTADDIAEQRFGFRRLHEDLGRRWTFSADAWSGTADASRVAASDPGHGYRAYTQVMADYRLGREPIRNGSTVSAYARLFAGNSGDSAWSLDTPTLGVGVNWKPWGDRVIYFAAEQQVPLDVQEGDDPRVDVMLRASASFLNAGRFSDDWHPTGRGWLAQNLYLDAAHYMRADRTAMTADYRLSYHYKVFSGQTIEPYAHAQYNAIIEEGFLRDSRVGVGVHWNWWYGENRYDAYRHRNTFGIEYQRAFKTYEGADKGRNSFLITFGGRW